MHINTSFQIASSISTFLSQHKLNIMSVLSNEEGFFFSSQLYFNHYFRLCLRNSIICLKKSPKKKPTLESEYVYLFSYQLRVKLACSPIIISGTTPISMASRIWPFVCDYTFSAWSVRLKGIIKLNYWIRMVISKHKSAREHDYICSQGIK